MFVVCEDNCGKIA